MSFGDLHKARQQRLKSHASHAAQASHSGLLDGYTGVSSGDAQPVGPASSQNGTPNDDNLVKISPGMFKDLPPNIEIRAEMNSGRGLYVSRSATAGYDPGKLKQDTGDVA